MRDELSRDPGKKMKARGGYLCCCTRIIYKVYVLCVKE